MAKIKFADEIENITTRKEFPLTKPFSATACKAPPNPSTCATTASM